MANDAKFRFVHVHAIRPGDGDWFTIQRDDYFPLRWGQVKDHREELAALCAAQDMKMGSIGDSYSEWLDWSLLPSWSVEPMERVPIA